MKLSIIVPAYNEESNLSPLLNSLNKVIKNEKWNVEVIIVNDNSNDNTGTVCKKLKEKYDYVRIINRKKGDNGMGYALREGTYNAKGEYIIWTMADLSDKPETYPLIYKKLEQGYDMVFGSRYMKGGSKGELEPMKAFYSFSYTLMCRIFFGIRVHDVTNAFRGFRKEVYKRIVLESGDYAISPEFAIKAELAGYKLGEVPTSYKYRKTGVSKFKIFKMFISYSKQLKYLFSRKKWLK